MSMRMYVSMLFRIWKKTQRMFELCSLCTSAAELVFKCDYVLLVFKFLSVSTDLCQVSCPVHVIHIFKFLPVLCQCFIEFISLTRSFNF